MENKTPKIFLMIITLICFILMIVSYIQSSALNPVREYMGYILVPVQRGVSAFGSDVYNAIEENKNLHQVYDENQELKRRLNTLEEENSRLRSETLELVRLRKLYSLDLEYLQYPKVAARVIARDSEKWFQVFRIDKGRADGIAEGMNVLSGAGLCGIVTDVGSNYATVRSIIDSESNVYAMAQHSADTCLVKGDAILFEEGLLQLTNINKNSGIQDGDAIVTSNLSTKYLPGILIGYADNIQVNSQHLTKSGTLIPVADFRNLQEVLVITQVKTEGEGAAAAPEEEHEN